jgi:uncharacterized protein (TIGR03435 family)
MLRYARWAVGICMGIALPLAYSQTPAASSTAGAAAAKAVTAATIAAPAADPTMGIVFDVVSIKPVEEKHNGHIDIPANGDGILIENQLLSEIVVWDYKLGGAWRQDQFQGAPKWFFTDNFDIRAKVAPEDVAAWQKLPEGARRLVFRKLLAERFKFAAHFVDVDSPVYNMVVAKGGLKIKEAKPGEASPFAFHVAGDPSTPYAGPGITSRQVNGRWITVMQQMHMSSLAKSYLTGEVGRQVIDKTGLLGAYNFSLDFSQEQMSAERPSDGGAPEPAGPSIFTALQEQLGLKLEAARGPVSNMVIEHVEKPAGD